MRGGLQMAVASALCVVLLIGAGGYAFDKLTPWPMVLRLRHAFHKGDVAAAATQAPFVPAGVSEQLGLRYAPGDPHALMDVFAPEGAGRPLPAVIWVHGGGFVSGSRATLRNYLKILAAKGFVTIGVDYALAPAGRYPEPVREANAALAYVRTHARALHVDPDRLFLAGDSAGAQIVAQAALGLADPAYARALGITPGAPLGSIRGLVLFCGLYDPSAVDPQSDLAWSARPEMWAYTGAPHLSDPRLRAMAIAPHVTAAFPPVFLSAGNGDPLQVQSEGLAKALQARGVVVDTLFFPPGRTPPLGHEYQFQFGDPAARLALERATAFLAAHAP